MFLDIAPFEPTVTNNTPTIIIISVAVFLVLVVAVLCTIFLKKKNAK